MSSVDYSSNSHASFGRRSARLAQKLAGYAAFHQDHRNVATHFVGIPLIVLAVMTLLARPDITVLGLEIPLAAPIALAMVAYYVSLDALFGAAMAVFLGLCVGVGDCLADQSRAVWLASGLGLFLVGWAIQFFGHYLEGQKPAFMDDLRSLLIGPLFLVAEAAFALGLRKDVEEAMGELTA